MGSHTGAIAALNLFALPQTIVRQPSQVYNRASLPFEGHTTMKYPTFITATIMLMLGLVGAAEPIIVATCAPNGATFKPRNGPTSDCQCSSASGATCSGFSICGIGNTNATVTVTSKFSATVQCENGGHQIVEVKSQDIPVTGEPEPLVAGKNGCLAVTSQSPAPPTPAQFEAAATCPNRNWTPIFKTGTIVVDSSTLTLRFDGFGCDFLTFSCP
jgi:hypothetical protein